MNRIAYYIAISCLVTWGFTFSVAGKTVDVGSDYEYNDLSTAIHKAEAHDTVYIHSGEYNLNNLLITKPLHLKGMGGPVLDGGGENQILLVRSDSVTIEGITFQNAGISFINDNAAVKLDSVKHCSVINNSFKNNFFAVYLAETSHSRISGNAIIAKSVRETYSGNGIHLWYCKNISIENNEISGHRDGIYFEFVKESYINNNISENNLRYGLHFMFSDNCSYSGNTFKHNGAGVAVMFTDKVEMRNNKFIENWGSASYGILLKEIFDSNISNNYFYKNSSGIYLEGCNRIKIENNDFFENGWAVRLMANSMDNKFNRNNFIGNSFDVTTNNIKNYNEFESNYWSEYDGYDLNKDNVGDVPHRPVRSFSLIVEQNRPTLILMRSLFVELIDFAEKVFPVLTPETLADNKPSMKKIKHVTNRELTQAIRNTESTR